jgi:xanthine/CO dehydrogenase XdhC/CoxF family maturation factor
LSLLGPRSTGPVGGLLTGYTVAAPVESVTVQGQSARLALRDAESGDDWLLVGQLPGGRFFVLLAPRELTREQVLQIGEQITYTP